MTALPFVLAEGTACSHPAEGHLNSPSACGHAAAATAGGLLGALLDSDCSAGQNEADNLLSLLRANLISQYLSLGLIENASGEQVSRKGGCS